MIYFSFAPAKCRYAISSLYLCPREWKREREREREREKREREREGGREETARFERGWVEEV